MDDVLTIDTSAYNKSDDLENIKPWQRAITIVQAIPLLSVKLLICGLALIFELLNQIFFCFVPRPLSDIRGKVAVVSV